MPLKNVWTQIKRRLQQLAINLDVTLYTLVLGSREGTTGWRAQSFNSSTIQMGIVPTSQSYQIFPSGGFARYDYSAYTSTAVTEGSYVKNSENLLFLINIVTPIKNGSTVDHYQCGLTYQTLLEVFPSTLTWTLTRPNDPRERIKSYITTKARSSQITKDNDSTQASWACIFADPPYPLKEEFRASSNPVQGLYVVDMPNSTPLRGHDLNPYGYTEHVPIHIITADSTGCTGTALAWKMEAEMRYVCENYLTGSFYMFERRSKHDRNIGGMWIYDTEFLLEYRRDTT